VKKTTKTELKGKVSRLLDRVKKLQGDPHYIALGMAIGVFVAITPTIPFHTVMAVALAYLFKASRPAAIIGVWASNPFTVVFLYIACYKVGMLLFGHALEDADSVMELVHAMENDIPIKEQLHLFVEFFHTQLKLFFAMNVGGVVLGIPGGIAAYVVTKNFIKKLKTPKNKRSKNQEAL